MLSTALQASVMLVLAVPHGRTQPAPNARPTGGSVAAGQAAISNAPNATTINQASQRAAINWQSFDVGSQQAVRFNQPNANAATLNRVTGPNPSQIAGQISANGTVVLVNPDGVYLSKGAQVNANGLIVSAAGVSNANFMAGHMVFDQPAHPNARVENQGNITVREAGLAALVAPQVANSGVINARLGHVVLAGASAATLDMYGDGLLAIDVTQQVTQVPKGPDGKPVTVLVTNSGTVLADGGTVQLTARAADGIVQNLVMAGGRIAAQSVGARTGTIALTGVGGSITVAGQLDATGKAPGTQGGAIEALASRGVTLATGAHVDASGRSAGGTVAIGTTLARAQGGPSLTAKHTSKTVSVQAGATIAANSPAGNAGRVTVLSTGHTQMDGTISARAAAAGANGGFVEVSGDTLGLTGPIDVSSPLGQHGTILLDPGTLKVVNSDTSDGTLDKSFTKTGSTNSIAFDNDGTTSPDTVTNFTLTKLGKAGDLILQAATLLEVQASVTVGNGLTMQSGHDLIVDSGISVKAGTTLSLTSGLDFATGSITAAGSIALDGASLDAPTLVLSAGTGGIAFGTANITTTTLKIDAAGGGISQAAGGIISAGASSASLQSTGTIIGDVQLLGASNNIGTLLDLHVAGDLTLVTTSALAISGQASAPGQTINLNAGGAITEPGGALNAGTLIAQSAGDISLNARQNVIGVIGGISATQGTVSVVADPTVLKITGASTGQTLFFKNPDQGGTIDLSNATLKATGTAGVTPRISLVADKLTQSVPSTMSLVTPGLIELAPATIGTNVTVDPTPGSAVDTVGAVLSAITPGAGTLSIGGFTGLDAKDTISAGNIAIAAKLDLAPIGNALALLANGNISQLSAADLLNVGTLSGSGADITLLNPGNQISAIAGLNATNGNVEIFSTTPMTVAGPVSATGSTAATGNIFLQQAPGQKLMLAGGLTATSRISLATDILTEGEAPSLTAATSVEIAPATPLSSVNLPGGSASAGTLVVDATVLGVINSPVLRIGGYHLGNADTITAGAIDINNAVSFGSGPVHTLQLDVTGTVAGSATVTESGGPLTVGTLAGSTNGSGGDFQLTNAGNQISALGTIVVTNGDLALLNAASLDVPASSVVIASNVSITNAGTVSIEGNVGACETSPTPGNLTIQATGGNPIIVGGKASSPLIGAFGTVFMLTDGAFTQNSGLINGTGVSISAGAAITQNGGTIYGLGTAGIGVSITAAAGDIIQGPSGLIASNSDITVLTPANISLAGSMLGAGNVRVGADGTITFSGPTIAAGGNLTAEAQTAGTNATEIDQNAGTVSAGATLTLASPAGTQAANAIVVGNDQEILGLPFNNFGTRVVFVQPGGNLVACECTLSGAITLPLPPTTSPQPYRPFHLNITRPVIAFSTLLDADWVELHSTTGDTTELGGGSINALLLTGSSARDALFDQSNLVTFLGNQSGSPAGNYTVGRNFTLSDSAPVSVAGLVQAGTTNPGATLRLSAPSLTIDNTGNALSVPATLNPQKLTIVANGTLNSAASISSGIVTPGQVLLQTNTLSIPQPNSTGIISAPDGFIAIAPLAQGTPMTLLGDATGGQIVLGGGSAPLAAFVTKGITPGTPGVATLALGSLDAGHTTTAGSITANLNGGTIDLTPVAATLQLNATGDVVETGASGSLIIPGLAGTAGSFTLEPGGAASNKIAVIGNSPSRSAGGTVFQTAPGSFGNLTDLTATSGDIRITNTDLPTTLTVIGTVSAADGKTVALASPTLVVDQLSRIATGAALDAAGSVTVNPIISGNTVMPGQVLLTADALRLLGLAGSHVIAAPAGMVAITPYTMGNVMTIAAVADNAPHAGIVAAGDLPLINTLQGPPFSPGPLGTETLAFGSVDNGASSIAAGGISIQAALNLTSIANTLALFAAQSPVAGSGVITQDPGATITVTALIGSAGIVRKNGTETVVGTGKTDINLAQANFIATIGNLGTAAAGIGDLLASGNITIFNAQDLMVRAGATVHAGDTPSAGPASTADIEIQGSGSLTVAGIVQSGSDGNLTGNLTLSAPGDITISGSVYASSQGNATITAGASIEIPGIIWGDRTDPTLANTVTLTAGLAIDEPGEIGAALLTGSSGWHASLTGANPHTGNRILQLGPFASDTAAGDAAPRFELHDGTATLAVTGPVQDQLGPITIANAPPGEEGGYLGGDIQLLGSVISPTTVSLAATGNVQELPGGLIIAPTLIAEAGVIPGTETIGTQPGVGSPAGAASSVVGPGSVLLDNLNQVDTLATGTAVQDFRATSIGLTSGTVIVLAPNATPGFGTILAGAGPGTATPVLALTTPLADLVVSGVLHAGIDTARTGNIVLNAGTTTGTNNVSVLGSVYAANGGNASVNATGSIFIPGIIWGDRTDPTLANTVSLTAGLTIDEPGEIGAALLTGSSGWHASLTGANPHTGNRILQLGSFSSDTAAGDAAPRFELHDGTATLTVTGPVQDQLGPVTIANAPPDGAGGYAIGDIQILGSIVSPAVLTLEATGNVVEQGNGIISAKTLIAQAGAIPDTETGLGNQPGTVPTAPVARASVWLANANTLDTLGNVTATNSFLLTDAATQLTVTGTVLAGAAPTTVAARVPAITPTSVPAAEIDALGNLTIADGATIQAGLATSGFPGGNVILRAGNETLPGALTIAGNSAVRAIADTRAGADTSGIVLLQAGVGGLSINPATAITGTPALMPGCTTCTINIAGLVSADTTTGLYAAADLMEPSGTLVTGLLTGMAGGAAGLSGAGSPTANRIARLGAFDTNVQFDHGVAAFANRGFLLRDGQALTVVDAVTDHGSVTSTGLQIAVAPPGARPDGYGVADLILQSSAAGTARLTANAATGAIDLQATGNVYEQAPDGAFASTLNAHGLIAQAGGIPDTEQAAGQNQPGRIAGSPVSLASIWLNNTNEIGALLNATATQHFQLHNGQSLSIPSGAVLAGAAATTTPSAPATNLFNNSAAVTPQAQIQVDTGDLMIANGATTAVIHAGLNGVRTGNVTLSATNGNVSIGGAVFAANAGTAIVTASGDIAIGGIIWGDGPPNGPGAPPALLLPSDPALDAQLGGLAGAIGLFAGNNIQESGAIGAAILTGRAGGQANMPGALSPTQNDIATLGPFDTTTGFLLRDEHQTLTVAGAIQNRGTGNIVISVGADGPIAGYGPADLDINAPITANGMITLQATGNVSETGAGVLTASALTAQAGSIPNTEGVAAQNQPGQTPATPVSLASIRLGNTNQIPTLTNATATQDFFLKVADGLTIPAGGAVAAGATATINGNAINVQGVLTAGAQLRFISGSINETGSINTPVLTGTAGSNAVLIGNNQIAQINDFTAGGTLQVEDNTNLLLTGSLIAPYIAINAQPHEITLGNGATIVTGGTTRPSGVPPGTLPPLPSSGAFFTGFRQTGTSFVTGFNGGPSTLVINATGSGENIAFDPSGGLIAPHTWLVLEVANRATITGNIFVGALDVDYKGQGGRSSLFGTINGIGGPTASGGANIEPQINANFRFNACPIRSVNCVLLPVLAVPVGNPLNDFSIGAMNDPNDDDLLLPIVSDKDY